MVDKFGFGDGHVVSFLLDYFSLFMHLFENLEWDVIIIFVFCQESLIVMGFQIVLKKFINPEKSCLVLTVCDKKV